MLKEDQENFVKRLRLIPKDINGAGVGDERKAITLDLKIEITRAS